MKLFGLVALACVGVAHAAPAAPTPSAIEGLLQAEFDKQIPTINAQLAATIKAGGYDPITLPDQTFSEEVDIPTCFGKSDAKATMTNGRVVGASKFGIDTMKVSNTVMAGLEISSLLTITTKTTQLSGSASAKASARCDLPGPYGGIPGPSLSGNLDVTFGVSPTSVIQAQIKGNLVRLQAEQCFSGFNVSSVDVKYDGITVAVSTSNVIFQFFTDDIKKAIEPAIEAKVKDTLNPLITDSINKMGKSMECAPTPAPTRRPTKLPTAPTSEPTNTPTASTPDEPQVSSSPLPSSTWVVGSALISGAVALKLVLS